MTHRTFARRFALVLVLSAAGGAASLPGRTMLAVAQSQPPPASPESRAFQDLRWRNVGPTRGGRVTAMAGVRSQPCTFYMGATGGGVWKTESCGADWTPLGDGQIATGSIGSIDVSESNPN